MDERIQRLVQRARMGDLTDEEKAELQQALLGAAPSSPEWRQLYSAVNPDLKASTGRQPVMTAGLSGIPNPFDIFKNGRGTPTMDFLEPLSGLKQGNGFDPRTPEALAMARADLPVIDEPTRLNAAEDNDLTGSQPLGSNATTSETTLGNREGSGTMGLAGRSIPGGPPTMRNNPGIDPIGMLPQGYSFSDGGAMGLAMYGNNPDAYLRNYAESKGGGANMAAYLAQPHAAALAMARSGLLGGGYGDTVNAGAGMGQAGVMAKAEDFLNEIGGADGGFVDPDMLVDEMVRRGVNTDYEGMTNPESNLPYTPEDIINATNASLMVAVPFMDQESAAFWESMLRGKGQEYITKLANGEIDANTSYPAWLESEGIQDVMG